MSDKRMKRRGGVRASTTTEMNRAQAMLNGDVPMDFGVLRVSYKKLEQNISRLQAMDEEIQIELGNDDIDADIADAEAYNDTVMTTLFTIDNVLSGQTTATQGGTPPMSDPTGASASAPSSSLKLPKFEMAPFNGDPTGWQPFWDVFKAAVHDKPISAVEKFSYLLGYLEGDAFSVAAGYSLTEANYEHVIAALEERFANKQRAQFTHVRALIALEPAKGRSLSEVRRVCDQFEAHIRSLDALDMNEDTFGIVFSSIILSKLPEYLTTKICEKTGRDDFKLSKIRDWIKADIAAREMSESSLAAMNAKKSEFQNGRSPQTRPPSTTSSLAAPKGPKTFERSIQSSCAFCSLTNHFHEDCPKFQTAKARMNELRRTRTAEGKPVCFVCLFPRFIHRSADCPLAWKECVHCGKKGHHRSLCYTAFGDKSQAQTFNNSSQWSKTRDNTSTTGQGAAGKNSKPDIDKRATPKKELSNIAVAGNDERSEVDVSYLQTAVVSAFDESSQRSATGRALMDGASSRTYITEDFCRKLGLRSICSTYLSVGRFKSTRRTTMEVKRVRFLIKCRDGCLQPVLANVTPVISCPVARYPIDTETCPLVHDLDLAEPLNSAPDSLDLDILIGSDQYFNFVSISGTLAHESGLVLVPSRLGFLTAGTMPLPLDKDKDNSPESTLVLLCPDAQPIDAILPHECCNLERFWQLEDVGTKEAKLQDTHDEEALRQFEETVQYRDGRYYVAWPWKTKEPNLHNNFGLALGRLRSTLRRLNEDDALLEEGIIERAPEKPDGMVYYIPHHFVIQPGKTTKFRIVYDASSKTQKDQSSLNDCLYRGPVILDDLCGLLMRFRLHKVAIVSDIEKAFLQVRLQHQERDVGRFLWVKDPKKPPSGDNLESWRFTSVFFGAIASPFLLAATVNTHLHRAGTDVARNIRENLYVDNIITGEDSDLNAIKHYREAKSLFLGASMNLREFYSNSVVVRDSFAPEDRGNSKEPSVLGIRWNYETDKLHCAGVKSLNETRVTKRIMARLVAQVFDPCGWFSPAVLPGKLLVQKTWALNLSWDESVPPDIDTKWAKVRDELSQISGISIPRYIGFESSASLELHAFGDASTLSTAVAVYLRKEDCDGFVTSDLVFAKTRLAPLKPEQTIPRLELIALQMGVNLVDFVAEQLRQKLSRKVVWSDSQSVLSWLRKEKLETKFVEKRVNQIREKKDISFRFVPGKDNPADLPSRGCSVEELMQSEKWWHGPKWLCLSPDKWPKDRTSDVKVEEPQELSVQLLVLEDTKPKTLLDPTKYSRLYKLLRVTAYVNRFVRNMRLDKSSRQVGPLTVQEVAAARAYWEKAAQVQGFPALQSHLTLERLKRSSVAQLNVFRDANGLLRCSGRLQNSLLPYDVVNPILLPKHHPVTRSIIRHVHLKNMHAGVAHTLAEVRQRYWIPQGRSQVKSVIRSCQTCRRVEGGPYRIPEAPSLPEFRVTIQEPFASTGLDYLGFLNAKASPNVTQKVWVCLFTCASSRAIHLELVENQSAAEFHLALRRFFALYGCPKLIVSDNASQFCTVETAMKKLWQELTSSTAIEDFATTNEIQWEKIPQLAPWMGGFFERLVGIVKKHLKKTLGQLCVSLSELRTILAEITAIVNSRPLLYVEDDVNSYQLSPANLLGKARCNSLPSFAEGRDTAVPSAQNAVDDIIVRWKRLQSISALFWENWRQSYLTSLREKHANASQRDTSLFQPTVNSVVLIKDKLPRAQWRLGKVENLYVSHDGKVRSVKLRLANGRNITRPIKLLYPLEMHVEKSKDQSESMTPFNASVDIEPESDFEGFDSQDVAEAVEQVEKYDEYENFLTAMSRQPVDNTENPPARPRRKKAKQALRKIRAQAQFLSGESSDEE